MKTTVTMILLLVVAGACSQPPALPGPLAEPVPRSEPKFERELDKLIWLLGHEDFDKRGEAHDSLVEKGKKILPDLEKTLIDITDGDQRHQVELVINDIRAGRKKVQKRGLLVKLHIDKNTFKNKETVKVRLELKNAGNAPLSVSMPLVRKYSVGFRLDWVADKTFMSGEKLQSLIVKDTERDAWISDSNWQPSMITLEPGKSVEETLDITDMCTQPARYTAIATYLWTGVGNFMSNSVTFEVKKPEAADPGKKQDGDN